MTIAPASKFIIVDHSLINLQGHHYECSIAVAETAQRAGYDVSILANKQFSQSLARDSVSFMPAFEVDWLNQGHRVADLCAIAASSSQTSKNPKQNSQNQTFYQSQLEYGIKSLESSF